MTWTLAHSLVRKLLHCPLRKTKPRPAWGRGGKKRLKRPRLPPPPIQMLMSSSRDGESWRKGGKGGWRRAWIPRPPGRLLGRQRLGLRSPGLSVTPAGTNCLQALSPHLL